MSPGDNYAGDTSVVSRLTQVAGGNSYYPKTYSSAAYEPRPQFLTAQQIVSAPFKLSEIRKLLLDVFLIGSALLFVAVGPLAAAGAAAVYILARI